jgi:hypothetical protein
MDQGKIYVLVFDPSDPESRSAYLTAQSIAQSQHRAAGSIGAPGERGTPNRPQAGGSEGTSDRLRSSDSVLASSLTSPSSQRIDSINYKSDQVKITGRVIEREGVAAIAVQSVEPKSGLSASAAALR